VTSSTESSPPIAVLANDVGVAAHHGSKLVTARFVEELGSRGFSVVTIPAGQKWTEHKDVLDRASVVVLNGEGTLHHSAPAAAELLGLAPYCQARSIPVFLANSIWQNNSVFLAQQARSFWGCFVRESASAEQLGAQRVPATVVPDLVLGWQTLDEATTDRGGIVITDSVLLSDTQRLYALSRRLPGAIFTSLRPPSVARENYTDHPFERLVATAPITLRDRLGRAKTRLYRARGALLTGTRRLLGHQKEFAVEDFFHTLRRAELLVTGRYHAVCMAMLTGTPFFAVASNSHKIDSMLHDAGLGHRVVSREALFEALAQPSTWSESDDRAVRSYVERARAEQKRMFDEIASRARHGEESGP
jgi:hypothetical protein